MSVVQKEITAVTERVDHGFFTGKSMAWLAQGPLLDQPLHFEVPDYTDSFIRIPRSHQHDPVEDSTGTAGVRGTQGFNEGEYYWEVIFTEPAFGTSIMVGVGTQKALLHTSNYQYIDMLGMDDQSWGLSYKGTLWHNGTCRQYCNPFFKNNTRIGILLNLYAGTLTFFKNGLNMGVAFKDLHRVGEELYPLACSTAAETELELGVRSSRKLRLQDKCYSAILQNIGRNDNDIDILPLPRSMKHTLKVDRHNACS